MDGRDGKGDDGESGDKERGEGVLEDPQSSQGKG